MTAALLPLGLNLIADTSKREVFLMEKIEYFIPLKKANVKEKLTAVPYFLCTRLEEDEERDEELREDLEPEEEREGALELLEVAP
jgi:hypothetical protein